METQMNVHEQTASLDDQIISGLGGLVIGATVWAALFGVVKVFEALGSGINLAELFASLGLSVPQLVDFKALWLQITSGGGFAPIPMISPKEINIVLYPPTSERLVFWIEQAYIYVPIAAGVLTTYLTYRRLLKMK